jgi:predicted aspartyl protease
MYRLRINFGDYNKIQTTIEDTDGSVSNVVQKSHTIEENHKVTQSDQQKLNLVDKLNGLTEAKINSRSLWDTNCVIVKLSKEAKNYQGLRALLDTGANVNVLPKEISKHLWHIIQISNRGQKQIDGSQLKTRGKFSTQLKHQNQSMGVDWLVLDNAEKTILIVDLCKNLKIIHQNFSFCEVNQVETSPKIKLVLGKDLDIVSSKYPEFFCGKFFGIHDEPATIQLVPGAKPRNIKGIKKYQDIPEAYKEPLKREL